MVDVALQGTGISAVDQVDRARVLQRLRLGDVVFRHITRAAALAVLIILGIILGFIWNWVIGIILIILGLLFGGFRRGRWY